MKTKCFITAMATVSFGLCAQAQDTTTTQTQTQANPPQRSVAYRADYVGHIGVGAELGAPIGVTAKYWLSNMYAADAALGWSPYSHSSAEIHADFLVNDFDCFQPSSGRLPIYAGIGLLGRFRDHHESNLAGFRFPLGISYMFDNTPIDVFAEIAPEAIFAPFGRLSFDASVGFHYWF
jgi:hypothetical protein